MAIRPSQRNIGMGTGIGVFDVDQPVTLTNNVVVTNASNGVWAVNATDARIINNTIANNTYDGISGWAWPVTPTTSLTTTILNNIVVNNGGCGINGYNGVTLIVDYNDVRGHTNEYCELASPPSGSHNISADPQFTNAATGDYRIYFGSPAMNTGTNVGAPLMIKMASLVHKWGAWILVHMKLLRLTAYICQQFSNNKR